MDKIKVGVFGAHRGMTMIGVLADHPSAVLTAVCDKYVPALDQVKKLAEEKGLSVALYENFEDFFQHDLDAVVLANYANEHAPFAIRLLKSGRHVLSEVLPCETMAQAVELIEAVEESGNVYAYAENYCYMPGPFEMWKRYQNGDIGEVQYAEGEYIHDCSSIWPQITYGDRNHWRNRMYSTFYCTHSLGPIITATGRRPVQVVGFETNQNLEHAPLSMFSGSAAGLELVTLDNGAIVRSIHGGLKREPGSINYQLYGKKGMFETNRWNGGEMSAYIEGDKYCHGDLQHYAPKRDDITAMYRGHGGSDFYPTHYFIEKILGTEEGKKYSIDVYTAVDMGICGILAFRSILSGNASVAVPDLRDPTQRDSYRNDHACTNPAVAGDQLLPRCSGKVPEIPDSEYEYMKQLWLNGKNVE